MTKIRKFAKECMGKVPAHGYDHAFRVGIMARNIARKESLKKLYLYEIAGLLHDIGLDFPDRSKHGEIGAKKAYSFLRQETDLSITELSEITYAISYHNRKLSAPKHSLILDVLADADTLDLLGAIGIWRGIQSRADANLPSPRQVAAAMNRFEEYNKSRKDKRENNTHSIAEQINFQIQSAKIITTSTGKKMAEPLLATMRHFRYMIVEELTQSK